MREFVSKKIFHCKPNLAKSRNLYGTSFHEILLITFLVLGRKKILIENVFTQYLSILLLPFSVKLTQ